MTVSWEIRQGDALERLREMPDESVHCAVTSPPYYGLRDYGMDGQIGLEPTLDEFLDRLLAVFAEVHRVLRSDGTLWVNIGDSYASKPRGSDNGWDKSRLNNPARVQKAQSASLRRSRHTASAAGAKQKDLMGVPWLLAFAMRDAGWWLREDIIWHKPTPMPEPVTDRCTRSHEYIFRFTKSARYFADQDAIREPLSAKTLTTFGTTRVPLGGGDLVKADNYAKAVPDRKPRVDAAGEPVGANKRSVWTVRGTPYPAAHFATFPPELVEPMVLAATAPSVCSECGAPWRRLLGERVDVDGASSGNGYVRPERIKGGLVSTNEEPWTPGYRPTIGWESDCEHAAAPTSALVLDPFAGAATTGLVALRHSRSFIGIELNAEYCDLARQRIVADAPLINQPAEVAAFARQALEKSR